MNLAAFIRDFLATFPQLSRNFPATLSQLSRDFPVILLKYSRNIPRTVSVIVPQPLQRRFVTIQVTNGEDCRKTSSRISHDDHLHCDTVTIHCDTHSLTRCLTNVYHILTAETWRILRKMTKWRMTFDIYYANRQTDDLMPTFNMYKYRVIFAIDLDTEQDIEQNKIRQNRQGTNLEELK